MRGVRSSMLPAPGRITASRPTNHTRSSGGGRTTESHVARLDRGAVAEGEITDIPSNAFASALLTLGDGLTLHLSLDPSGFRGNNIARILAATVAGLSGDDE